MTTDEQVLVALDEATQDQAIASVRDVLLQPVVTVTYDTVRMALARLRDRGDVERVHGGYRIAAGR